MESYAMDKLELITPWGFTLNAQGTPGIVAAIILVAMWLISRQFKR
jgi:hypothetical protein